MQQIVDEIDAAAESCSATAAAMYHALDAHGLGFIGGILQRFVSDGPARSLPAARPSSPSRAVSAPNEECAKSSETTGDGEYLSAQFERLHAKQPAEQTTIPNLTANATSPPHKSESTTNEPGPTGRPIDKDTLLAVLRTIKAAPRKSSFDLLREALAKIENTLLKSGDRANAVLEHVETIILPKIDVLIEEFDDKAIASHRADIIRLSEMRGMGYNLVERVFTGNADRLTESASPADVTKFMDIAFGRRRDSLVGVFIGCTILGELGVHLKQIASRMHTRNAIIKSRNGSTNQTGMSTKPPPVDSDSTSTRIQGGAADTSSAETDVDFVILTAIDVELRAVKAAFGLTARDRIRRGTRVYWRGKVPLDNGEFYSIVVGQTADVANADAALATAEMLREWSPSAALLVGIAASTTPTKVKLGDVVIGSDVYYYERSKVTRKRSLPEPKSIPADPTLLNNMRSMDWDGAVDAARPDGTDLNSTRHYGVIACGEKVVADAILRDEITIANRKILAIEMEGYGFSLAVWNDVRKVRHLVIRGICDDASEAKDDRWHEYAAKAAASLTKYFLLDRPLEPRAQSLVSASDVTRKP
jgi:nucleoside phosphorylase